MSISKPIYIIVAVAKNGVIGQQGHLPWRIPEDWDYMLNCTRGGIMIEGRRCYEELGGALPGRKTIVLSRRLPPLADALTATSLAHALDQAQSLPEGNIIWIAGGEQVYKEAMPLARRLYITRIDHAFEGDTHFPAWQDYFPHCLESRASSDANYRYTFEVYSKTSGCD